MSDNETEQKKGRGRPAKVKASKKNEEVKPVDETNKSVTDGNKAVVEKEETVLPLKRGRPMRKAAEEANKKSSEKKEEADDYEPKVKRGRGRPAGSNKAKKAVPRGKGRRGRPKKTKQSAVTTNTAKENESDDASMGEEAPSSSGEDKTDD